MVSRETSEYLSPLRLRGTTCPVRVAPAAQEGGTERGGESTAPVCLPRQSQGEDGV